MASSRTATAGDPHPPSAELAAASLEELGGLLERGEATSVELVSALVARIAALDHAGARLSAVLALDPGALDAAESSDLARARGERPGPLAGIPVLVKDNIDTAGLASTAGSLALAGAPPDTDATVVAKLRAAGAIVLGKANLSEWANFRSRHSSSGWSALGGQTRNPHALDRSPGGSSSGSAAALAAGLAPLALGTETDGSILCPAALNGVVGLKPTVGLVSRAGVVPLAESQDTVGPFARSVRDAALVLEVLAGADPLDPATARASAGRYVAACGPDGLAGARIGVVRGPFAGYHPAADRLVDEVLACAAGAGAAVVEDCEVPGAAELDEREDELVVLSHEFHAGIDRYLAARPGPRDALPRSLAELVAFNEAHAARELALFGQDLFETALETGGLDDPAYCAARARDLDRTRTRGIDAALDAGRLDALCALTMGPAWCIDQVNGDPDVRAGYSIAAIAGYPSISVPIGSLSGLPVGLALIGRAWSEATLVRLASGLEHVLGLDLRPSWRESVPLA